jgi:hypothetical protein
MSQEAACFSWRYVTHPDRRLKLLRPWPKPPPTITEAVLVTVTRCLELADAALAHSADARPRHRPVFDASCINSVRLCLQNPTIQNCQF